MAKLKSRVRRQPQIVEERRGDFFPTSTGDSRLLARVMSGGGHTPVSRGADEILLKHPVDSSERIVL